LLQRRDIVTFRMDEIQVNILKWNAYYDATSSVKKSSNNIK